jgi:hypothetical protein
MAARDEGVFIRHGVGFPFDCDKIGYRNQTLITIINGSELALASDRRIVFFRCLVFEKSSLR